MSIQYYVLSLTDKNNVKYYNITLYYVRYTFCNNTESELIVNAVEK